MTRSPRVQNFIVARRMFQDQHRLLDFTERRVTCRLQRRFDRFSFRRRFSELGRKRCQRYKIRGVRSSGHHACVRVRDSARNADIGGPQFTLVVSSRAQARRVTRTFRVGLTTRLVLTITRGLMVTNGGTIRLLVNRQHVLLMGPAITFTFTFRFSRTITMVMSTGAMFLTRRRAISFFLVHNIPVVIRMRTTGRVTTVAHVLIGTGRQYRARVRVNFLHM